MLRQARGLDSRRPGEPGRITERRTIRTIGGLLAAGLAIALAASPALAVDWGPDVKLSSTLTSDHELVRTGPTSAIAVWQRTSTLIARRTTDGGRTWLPSQTLATGIGFGSSVSGVGSNVDAVYVRGVRCPSNGDIAWRLFYRRSSDGGATWTAARALTSACSQVAEPDVARSADGQVSVVWTGLFTGRILMRTSHHGGASFGAAVHVASTTAMGGDTIIGSRWSYGAAPEVAIGSGGTTYVAYVASVATYSTVAVRRSVNRGQTWSASRTISTAAVSVSGLLADGARAVIGYTDISGDRMNAAYRTTADRGSTWSSQRSVVSRSARQFSMGPEFAIDRGVLGVIVKVGTPGYSPVRYRQSTNWGTTWSSAIRISPPPRAGLDPEPAGLALLAEHVLASHAENGGTEGVWIRQGTR